MGQRKPLVTVAILVYRNFDYIKDCIKSVLEQNYPEIQLIISDDGSDIFDKEMIVDYINTQKRSNIKDVLIYTTECNVGTSRNFNFALSKAEGKYIKFIAADDLFYDVDSLSKLVIVAETESSNVVIARASNYDTYLERWEWTYPSDEHWKQMKEAEKDAKTFFGIMSQYCLISAPSTLFCREFLNEMGGADERYRLIEDWPLWMKMLRSGKAFTFLNEIVVVYRSGGVSNGKKNKLYGQHQIEYADVIRYECLAYPEAFASQMQYKLAQKSERRHRFDGERLMPENKSWKKQILLICFYWDVCIDKFLDRGRPLFWKVQQYKRKLLLLAVILLTLSCITDYTALWNVILPDRTAKILGGIFYDTGVVFSWLCLAASVVLYMGALAVALWNTMKYSAKK